MRTLSITALAVTMAAVAGSPSYARGSHSRGGIYIGRHGYRKYR